MKLVKPGRGDVACSRRGKRRKQSNVAGSRHSPEQRGVHRQRHGVPAFAEATNLAQADFVGQLAAALGSDGSAVHAPTWDASSGIATWQRGGTDPAAAPYADFVAVRIVPGGLVECVVPNLHVAKAELGTRAARLVASSVALAGSGSGKIAPPSTR